MKPWNKRQWDNWLKGSGIISWPEKLANELHKSIKRNFEKRRVISFNVDNIWCSD